MTHFVKYLFILCLFDGMLSSAGAAVREWTDIKGRKIEAEPISKTSEHVTVLLKGKKVNLPFNVLSQLDLDFVKNWEPQPKVKDQVESADKTAATDDKEAMFNQTWPKLISGDNGMDIEEVKNADGSVIYRTENYEFIADQAISMVAVKRFAVLFEATRLYVQALPYANEKAVKKGMRYKIYLFAKIEDYRRAGGRANAAGHYEPGTGLIKVPFASLGLVKRGKQWAYDYEATNKTLPHEITHQITDDAYFAKGALGWFSEGFAEYVATTPYRSGKFSVNAAPRSVEQYVTAFSKKDGRGRALGTEVKCQDLRAFMLLSYDEFTRNGNFNYGVSALLVTYFNHYDGDGDAKNLKNFLRSLKSGKVGDEALEALLAGRSWDELEESISKQWSQRGVNISFQ